VILRDLADLRPFHHRDFVRDGYLFLLGHLVSKRSEACSHQSACNAALRDVVERAAAPRSFFFLFGLTLYLPPDKAVHALEYARFADFHIGHASHPFSHESYWIIPDISEERAECKKVNKLVTIAGLKMDRVRNSIDTCRRCIVGPWGRDQ
jgi:hypothetical protein